MTKIRRNSKKPIINIAYLLMVFVLARMFAIGMSLKSGFWTQLGFVIVISLIFRFLVIKPLYLYGLIILSIITTFVMQRFQPEVYGSFIDSFFNLVNNVINNIAGVENISLDNRLPLWIILLAAISLFTGLVLFNNRSRILIPMLYMPIFLIYWYSFYDQALVLMTIFIFSYLLILGYDSLLMTASKENQSEEGNVTKLYPDWISAVIYYSLIIVVLAAGLPGTPDYIRWPWLNQRITSAFPVIQELRSAESGRRTAGNALSFDFSTTGFQTDSTSLGGPVTIDDTVVMTIRGDRVNYLRGNITHHYTGRGWETNPLTFRTVQNNTDFSGLSAVEKDLFYRVVNFSITNESISSTTIFSPYIPSSLNTDEESSALVSDDFAIIYPDGIYIGESYFIRSYVPRSYGIQVDRGINKSLENLRDSELYLQLPDGITDRTIELTQSITDSEEFPVQKAFAIEKHLRDNFIYNLDVPHVPENSDFVDHFLFQDKEGYCTYFASAMTVMLRIEGIPARYVEGFLVKQESAPGIYQVRNSNAHTWVEAYIEPVGWMMFEPTPAYPLQARLLDYNPDLEYQPDGDLSEGVSRDPESVDGRDEGVDEGTSDGIDSENGQGQNPLYSISRFAFWALVVVSLIVAWKFVRGIYQEKKEKELYATWSPRDKILYQYENIAQIIQDLGYETNPGETHFEYAHRISHKFHDFGKFGFKQATDLFVKTKYGSYLPGFEEVESMESYGVKLEEQLKRHLGILTYSSIKLSILFNISLYSS